MSKPRFLCDECTHPGLAAALRGLEPTIDVLRIGDTLAPPLGTLDSEVLVAAEALGRVLVTNDRSTMPLHLVDHFIAGRHTAGVILMRQGFSLGRLAQEIVNLWAATTAEDWLDRTDYIP